MSPAGEPWVKYALLQQDGDVVGALRFVYRWTTVHWQRWFRRRRTRVLTLEVAVVEHESDGSRVPSEFRDPDVSWVDESILVSDSWWEDVLRGRRFESTLEAGRVLEIRPMSTADAALAVPWFDGFDWDVLPDDAGPRRA
jgi:hypothetical protein